MSETRHPVCPICKKEVLLPFSIIHYEASKTFGNWFCSNCGFCISTDDSRCYEPKEDIKVSLIPELATRIRELKRIYETKYKKPL